MSRAQKSDEEIQALAKKQLRLPQTVSVRRRRRLLSVSRTVSNEMIPQSASIPMFYIAELKKHIRIFPDDLHVRGYYFAHSPLYLPFLSLFALLCFLPSRLLASHAFVGEHGKSMTRYVTFDALSMTHVLSAIFRRCFVLAFQAYVSSYSFLPAIICRESHTAYMQNLPCLNPFLLIAMCLRTLLIKPTNRLSLKACFCSNQVY